MTFVLPPPMTVVPPELFELVASDCDVTIAEATPAATPPPAAGRGHHGGRSSRPDWRWHDIKRRRARPIAIAIDCQTF